MLRQSSVATKVSWCGGCHFELGSRRYLFVNKFPSTVAALIWPVLCPLHVRKIEVPHCCIASFEGNSIMIAIPTLPFVFLAWAEQIPRTRLVPVSRFLPFFSEERFWCFGVRATAALSVAQTSDSFIVSNCKEGAFCCSSVGSSSMLNSSRSSAREFSLCCVFFSAEIEVRKCHFKCSDQPDNMHTCLEGEVSALLAFAMASTRSLNVVTPD